VGYCETTADSPRGVPLSSLEIVAQPIETEICITGRELTEPTLSPDGNLIAYVTSEAGVTGIRVAPLTGGPERSVTSLPQPAAGRGLGGGCLCWIDEGRAISYVGRDGALWAVALEGSPARRLVMAPGSGIAAPASTRDGSLIVVSCNDAEIWMLWSDGRNPPMRVDLGEDDFVCDPQIRLVGNSDGAEVLHVVWQAWNVPDMAWDHSILRRVTLRAAEQTTAVRQRWEVVSRELIKGSGAIIQPQILSDGRVSCVRDDGGWLNLWIEDQPVISENFEHGGPTWGPGLRSYAWSPDESMVAFTRNESGFGRLCTLNMATGQITEISRGVHGHLEWRSDHLVAVRTGARTPTQIVSYRLGAKAEGLPGPAVSRRIHQIGPVIAWDNVDLGEPELMETRDGDTRLHARIYRAQESSRAEAMILWVHGGPTDQWQVTFMPRVAWLCSLGLDVLVVDPRGSTGHGRAYQQALRGRWGELDAADTAALADAYQRSSGIAPQRTLIAGSSSGGLTVMAVLRHHRHLVAGGIAISPVSDLADLARRSHRYEAHYCLSLVGDASDEDHYRELSPVFYADQIAGPLLMIHGEDDPVVPADHSRTLAERISAGGQKVDLHLFAGEGHGLRQIPHRLEEYRLIKKFIDQILIGG
jgi:dipeptidyl aminopeptidase/acylaminoacyl peptidase